VRRVPFVIPNEGKVELDFKKHNRDSKYKQVLYVSRITFPITAVMDCTNLFGFLTARRDTKEVIPVKLRYARQVGDTNASADTSESEIEIDWAGDDGAGVFA
jgi:hypothetical protein